MKGCVYRRKFSFQGLLQPVKILCNGSTWNVHSVQNPMWTIYPSRPSRSTFCFTTVYFLPEQWKIDQQLEIGSLHSEWLDSGVSHLCASHKGNILTWATYCRYPRIWLCEKSPRLGIKKRRILKIRIQRVSEQEHR